MPCIGDAGNGLGESRMTQTTPMNSLNQNLFRFEQTMRRFGFLMLAVMVVAACGCSRSYWRQNADREVYHTISERLNDPRWQLPRVDVAPDPDSRFFDPYDPDCGPLPPDDPAANVYMQCVNGMRGSKSWHKMGQSFSVENPQWLNRYGLSPEMLNPTTGDYTGRMPTLKNLTLAECVELSLMHSRELQTSLEDMYLSALAVTFERFQFNVRYLGIGRQEPNGLVTDTIVPHGPGDKFAMGGVFGISRLLPAGGQVAAELANNTIWLFSTPNQPSSTSILSYSVIQPLFAGAGRKVVMENLTQSERNLLYQARTLSRFRQLLFTNVVSDGTGSFLNQIQQIQVIRNQEQNIERLKNQVTLLQANASQKSSIVRADLKAMPEGLVIPDVLHGKLRFDADNFELNWFDSKMTPEEEAALIELVQGPNIPANSQFPSAAKELIQSIRGTTTTLNVLSLQGNLASSINQLRTQERILQDSLDAFKLSLGLPTDLILTIDDSMLDPFAVIAPNLKTLETEVTDFIDVIGEIDDKDPSLEQLISTNDALSALVKKVEQVGFPILDEDVRKLKLKFDARLAGLELEEDRVRVQADVKRDLNALEDARSRLTFLVQAMSELDVKIRTPEPIPVEEEDSPVPAKPEKADEGEAIPLPGDEAPDSPDLERRKNLLVEISVARERLLQITRSLTVVEIGVRVEQIEIPDFEMPLEQVVQNAVENRVDLMNQKAVVMDLRRKMEIAANQLMGNVDVVIAGDIKSSGGNNPFDFSGKNSQLRSGLRFTAPLDQIDERNAYRTSLIAYQRARRDFMALEDQVKLQVRRNWRQLTVQKRNLETSRLQLRLAARQYESAVDDAASPVQTGGAGVQATNLLQALSSVVSAQNSLIQNWVTYEQNRLGIYRDMGMMEIGPDGIWNDPQYRRSADQETQGGLPGRQTLPDEETDDGKEEAVPIMDNADGLGLSRPLRRGSGRDDQAEGLARSMDWTQQTRLFRTDYQARREEAVSNQSFGPGLS